MVKIIKTDKTLNHLVTEYKGKLKRLKIYIDYIEERRVLISKI